MATSTPAREHVTWFIHSERPELFVARAVRAPFDAADLRWTVDTPEDLELVRRLYAELDLGDAHGGRSRRSSPTSARTRSSQAINAHVEQKRS